MTLLTILLTNFAHSYVATVYMAYSVVATQSMHDFIVLDYIYALGIYVPPTKPMLHNGDKHIDIHSTYNKNYLPVKPYIKEIKYTV